MLEGLDAIDWENLTHAYGQAAGIPERIHLLTSPDPNKWVNAMSDLYDSEGESSVLKVLLPTCFRSF